MPLSSPMSILNYPWTTISASCPSPSKMIPIGVLRSPAVSSLLVNLFFNPRILREAWIKVTEREEFERSLTVILTTVTSNIIRSWIQFTFLKNLSKYLLYIPGFTTCYYMRKIYCTNYIFVFTIFLIEYCTNLLSILNYRTDKALNSSFY